MIQRNHQFNNLKLGIKLSLITNAQYRYEGILAGINLIDNTIILKNVKFFGYENRIPPHNDNNYDKENHDPDQQNNKIPIIGTIFDSITFWISSIHQINSLNSMKSFNQYELNNKTMIKTNSSIRSHKEKYRRHNSLCYAPRDQKRLMGISSFKNKSTTGDSLVVNSRRDSSNQRTVHQSRILDSYSRRSRNVRPLLKQRNYMPMFQVVPHPGNFYKFGYPLTVQNPPFRLLSNSIPPKFGHMGLRYFNKKQNRPMRIPNSGYRQHIQSSVNPYGMYVYLSPEMATTMQQRSTNFMTPQFRGTRRRVTQRKSTRNNRKVLSEEIDCTKPYDFEMANAELEAELAKMNLNTDEDSVSQENSEVDQTVGERPIPSTAANNASRLQTNPNTLSGESPSGVVSSTTANSTNVLISENKRSSESKETLSKGEYYVREKCFYDQISRSDGRPRGLTDLQNGRRKYKKSTSSHYDIGLSTPGKKSNANGTMTRITRASSSKRERLLNFETFGPMATRRLYWPQRKSSSVPRNLLVSASA
ncbi:hypothetical protein MS3_00009286 [Schistosoma haematobium]|uniref:Lsm14-like N-terminal domain-containing protein n=1 Tax=Schistosoma haematobium TaxID=6185 RepID=A0A095ARB3_SCHHA|nr:hypothetical protein MS3_00009286 [Schistosoma haematobium]KAH9580733.1 hypothetical protein MS3_00009286 [Schistosoma haematobium]CAH8602415.1 unnamed protein product [Schistosoma haematobium]CAH8609103.1 unnamed protein product [Schistosoma haematobium]